MTLSSAPSPMDSSGGAPEPSPNRRLRTFQIVHPDQRPVGALVWTTGRQKSLLRRHWRHTVMHRFSDSSRALRLAWILQELSGDKGYAFATDAYLASETGVPPNKVSDALKDLQDAGCIIRIHVEKNGRLQRRIFLATETLRLKASGRSVSAIPATVGDQDTPYSGPSNTPQGGGTEIKRETRTYRYPRNQTIKSTVAEAAEMDAARRAARARGELPSPWFSDDG